MTTIAVSRSLLMMAADGNMTIDGRKTRSDPKIIRLRDCIVGIAGDESHIQPLFAWLHRREGNMPRHKDRTAVLLYRDGRMTTIDAGCAKEVDIPEDHFAIGSGSNFAVAAMDAMEMMGLPVDPRIAVNVACRRDPGSDEPIQVLRWKANASQAKGK
jgi:ATP-dependent protease HslVU (ClpYQ) peptidase subunit